MLSIGIVGLPNVGKSTLFNALTKGSVPAENYPFCTIDPSVGVVQVPDTRLDRLAEFSDSKKKTPTAIEFVDIAGLVSGASQGDGLGNKFLSHIREVDAILEVVRFFDDTDITHVYDDIDPTRDIEVINLELILDDQARVAKRREKLVRDVRARATGASEEDAALVRIEQALSSGKLARSVSLSVEEDAYVTHLNLLTRKPILYACNEKTGGHTLSSTDDGRAQKAYDLISSYGSQVIHVDAATEHELNDVSQEDKTMFRQELGVQEDGLAELIRAAYDTLGLITFFTAGADESRAWTVARGTSAPVAGAVIHSDFQDKFIRAEVIPYDKLLSAGSTQVAREKALIKSEGKEYVVQDGDVMVFLHS